MNQPLIFSQPTPIKAVSLIPPQTLVIVGTNYVELFNIGTAKKTSTYFLDEDAMPIGMWLKENRAQNKKTSNEKQAESESEGVIVLEGKMGVNYVLGYTVQPNNIWFIKKYKTNLFGFCRMIQMGSSQIMGISDSTNSLIVFNMETGQQLYNLPFAEEQYCQNLTCITSIDHPFQLFTAQQGNILRRYFITLDTSPTIESLPMEFESALTIASNQNLKIPTGLLVHQQKLYVTLRKDANVYMINTNPTLEILQIIEYKLDMPKNICSINHKLIVCDKNKVLQINLNSEAQKGNISTLVEVKQSKNIGYIHASHHAICGSTQQNQFFYLEAQDTV